MSATGFTPVQIYSSSTGGASPVAGNLINSSLGSELAINITDGYLFYKDNSNAIQKIGYKLVPVTAGGTGLTSVTAGYIPFGSTASALTTSSTFTYVTATTNFVVGKTAPYSTTTDVGTFEKNQAAASRVLISNQTNDAAALSGLDFQAYGGGWKIDVPGSGTFTNPMIFKFNTTENLRFFSSGGVSIGNTTDPGATNLSVTGNVTAAIYNTLSGSVASVVNNTFTTMFTFPNVTAGTWIVTTTVTGQGNATYYTEVTIVSTQATASNLTRIQQSTGSNVQMSGLDFQFKQTSGGTQTCTYSAIRIF